jgi:hypothetical protein
MISLLFENTTVLSLSESWDRSCSVMNDKPLSAAYWKIEEMSGEKYLDELPELQLNMDQICSGMN